MTISGGLAYLQYGWETVAYGTEAGTIDKAFGHGVELDKTIRNNIIKVSGLGDRNVQSQVAGKFEGTFTINFVGASSYFWKSVLGTATDGGSGPYTHVFSETDSIPSMSLESGYDMSTDSCQMMLGAKVNNCRISANQGETVNVTLDGFYKTETEDSTIDGTPATESEVHLTFAQGTLELYDGSYASVGTVQSFELNITNNLELLWGLGSRFATSGVEKLREYNGTITVYFEDVSKLLDRVYGANGAPASSVTEYDYLRLTLTNGEAGTALRKWELVLSTAILGEHTINPRVNEAVVENVPFSARSLTVTGTDNTAATP